MVNIPDGYNPQFDIDLRYGKDCERLVAKMLTGFHEVKSDRMALATGNLFIEFEYKGNPSGINTSTADWWTFHLDDGMYFILSQDKLRELCDGAVVVNGGDQMGSRGYLLPLKEVFSGKAI